MTRSEQLLAYAQALARFRHDPIGFIAWAFVDPPENQEAALVLWSLLTSPQTMGVYVCSKDDWAALGRTTDIFAASHPEIEISFSERKVSCGWAWQIIRLGCDDQSARFAGLMNAGRRIVIAINGECLLERFALDVLWSAMLGGESETILIRGDGALMKEQERDPC